jgi:hypothetical protein
VNRHKAIIITLTSDTREDDPGLQGALAVLRLVPGIASAEPVPAEGTVDEHVALERAKQDVGVRCIQAVTKAVYDTPDRTL